MRTQAPAHAHARTPARTPPTHTHTHTHKHINTHAHTHCPTATGAAIFRQVQLLLNTQPLKAALRRRFMAEALVKQL